MQSTQEIKASVPLSEVVSRYVELKPRSGELWGRCPFHDERTPSFAVRDTKGQYFCQGCGAGGDVFDFIQHMENTDFKGAKEFLTGREWQGQTVSPTLSAEPAPRKNREKAVEIWKETDPAQGTLAEVYLRSRGITIPVPPTIRFHPKLYHPYEKTHFPALVAAVSDRARKVVAIQRIYLRDGGGGKASVDPAKMSLGSVKGAAVRLSPLGDVLVLVEGIEDGLTILQGRPEFTVWATLGTQTLSSQTIPPETKKLIIGADNDTAGQEAAKEAAAHYTRQGFDVRIATPKNGKDFNEGLQKRNVK